MGCFSSKTTQENFSEKATGSQTTFSPFKGPRPIEFSLVLPEMPIPERHGHKDDDLTGRVLLDGPANTNGQTCDVYRGRILPADDTVSVKVLRGFRSNIGLDDGKSWTRSVLRRLEDEVKLLQHISHPRVLQTYGYAEVRELPAVVTEWCSNGNVKDYLAGHPYGDRYALICEIAEGLEYLHSRTIIHGGVKPSKIMIGDDGRALVGDFMLSNIMAENIKSEAPGEDHAMSGRQNAPETLLGGSPSFEGDVYAFACVTMEILTDEIPYSETSSDLAVLAAKLHGRPPYDLNNPTSQQSLSNVPTAICQLLPSCWNEDPSERPSMREVLLRLRMYHQ